jgi:hypothetical protein
MEDTPNMKCTTCDSDRGAVRDVERRESRAGVDFVTQLPARVCLDCGGALFAGPVLEKLDLAIALWLARSGRVDGESLRAMRKALGRAAKELADLLGVSAETLSRWESGAMPMDPHAFVIVGGMVADRIADRAETVVRLEAVRAPAV